MFSNSKRRGELKLVMSMERIKTRVPLLKAMIFVSLCALSLTACHKQWGGHTFVVGYTWDTQVQVLSIRDASSNEEVVTDQNLKARISVAANNELPRWLRLYKLRRAKGIFHIYFPPSGEPSIAEASAGIEGNGSEFIVDPDVTPLMTSAHYGRLDDVKRILAAGENVNARDQRGDTALMAAVSSGNVEIVRLIIARGADLNARNLDDETALTLSSMSGQSQIVDELILSGARLDCNNRVDREALRIARERKSHHPEINRALTVNCDDPMS